MYEKYSLKKSEHTKQQLTLYQYQPLSKSTNNYHTNDNKNNIKKRITYLQNEREKSQNIQRPNPVKPY